MALSTLPMSAALASRPPIISDCDVGTAPPRAVLALDLGTTTGWALRLNTGGTVSGVMTFKPSRFEGGGMRYLRFRRWLDEMIDLAGGLERVVFEEVRRHVSTDSSHAYGFFLPRSPLGASSNPSPMRASRSARSSAMPPARAMPTRRP